MLWDSWQRIGKVLKAKETDTAQGQGILIPDDREEKNLRPQLLGPKLLLLHIICVSQGPTQPFCVCFPHYISTFLLGLHEN